MHGATIKITWVFGYNMKMVSKFCETLFAPDSFRMYPRALKVMVTQHTHFSSIKSESKSRK